MKTAGLVGLEEITDARRRLRGVAVETPLDLSRSLSDLVGGQVYIKCENLQRTGSFKIRGAFNRVSRLSDRERSVGVVAASAGNHAQGVALAASLSGIESTIFMPRAAPLPKIEATKRYGGTVELVGKDFGEAYEAARDHMERTGATLVHPFDHPDVIAGQGAVGCEIAEQAPDDIASVVVPVGGGGLISGVAAALRELRPRVRIVGVQAKGASSFQPSLDAGKPVTLESMATIADGIAANRPGDLTFAHVRSLVDEIVTVSDEAIAEAIVYAAERMKLILEPAGAAGAAALMQGVADFQPPAVVVLSGGNIDPLLLLRLVRFGLSSSGRYFAFTTKIPDQPGELARLLSTIAELGANLVGVEHHREGVSMHLEEVEVAVQIETKGRPHIEDVTEALERSGYSVSPL